MSVYSVERHFACPLSTRQRWLSISISYSPWHIHYRSNQLFIISVLAAIQAAKTEKVSTPWQSVLQYERMTVSLRWKDWILGRVKITHLFVLYHLTLPLCLSGPSYKAVDWKSSSQTERDSGTLLKQNVAEVLHQLFLEFKPNLKYFFLLYFFGLKVTI